MDQLHLNYNYLFTDVHIEKALSVDKVRKNEVRTIKMQYLLASTKEDIAMHVVKAIPLGWYHALEGGFLSPRL